MSDDKMTITPDVFSTLDALKIEQPEYSEWRCYMFGSRPDAEGIVWRPVKGCEPNWFWRWMQYVCFGNYWSKK